MKRAPKPQLVRSQQPYSDPYPHDLDAEQAVLGAIVIDNQHLVTASELVTADHFYRDAHQRIFRAMLTMHARGTAIDFVTLKHELTSLGELDEIGGPVYLASLGTETLRTANVRHYAGIVRRCAVQRGIIGAASHLARSAYEHDVDVIESWLHETATAVAALEHRSSEMPVVVNMAQVELQNVRWLWTNRLAPGELTLLAAEPGIGKSFLSLDIAARLTTNREPPGGPRPEGPMSVLIMAPEDPPEAIKNRLASLGADSSRVHLCVDKVAHSQRGPVRLADLKVIERAVADTRPKLLIIDPVNSFMTGDTYHDLEVRRLLMPVLRVARDHDMAVLGLMHQTKNTATPAIYRTLGTIGFVGIARVVMNVLADKDNPRRRWLITIKNNLGPIGEDHDGIAFTLEQNRVVWDASQRVDYAALVDAQVIGKDAPEQLTATEFLKALLNDVREKWPLDAEPTIDMAKRNGISPSALNRARRSLKISSIKKGFGKDAKWRWLKPRPPRQSAKK